MSLAKAGPRPAPKFESNELLLFRSARGVSFGMWVRRRGSALPAMFVTFWEVLLLEVWNKGTGGRCLARCCS
jgi:hypothetical protein